MLKSSTTLSQKDELARVTSLPSRRSAGKGDLLARRLYVRGLDLAKIHLEYLDPTAHSCLMILGHQ